MQSHNFDLWIFSLLENEKALLFEVWGVFCREETLIFCLPSKLCFRNWSLKKNRFSTHKFEFLAKSERV